MVKADRRRGAAQLNGRYSIGKHAMTVKNALPLSGVLLILGGLAFFAGAYFDYPANRTMLRQRWSASAACSAQLAAPSPPIPMRVTTGT